VALPPGLVIRNYEAKDREAVRGLCCDTGYLGQPIDPVFQDRELFADYLTSYYTDVEPEASFVVESEGVVKGYLLGSHCPIKQQRHSFFLNLSLCWRAMLRYRGYNRATRDFIGWVLRNSWREVPAAPRLNAHFHFNLLPEVQSIAGTRALMNAYFNYLMSVGEHAVYGQVVTFDAKRGAKLFERYGFQVIEKREITKYRRVHPEPVYLTTIVKELDAKDGEAMRTVAH